MKIFINDMFVSNKNKFTYNYEPNINSYEMQGRKVKFLSKPSILCEIIKQEDTNLYTDITIHLDTSINCVRCLGDMYAKQSVHISGILSNQDKDVDYDIILFDDDCLDLDKVFYDAVFEHLNDYLYCSDDCKGLCHNCGVNLNHNSCTCNENIVNIDPRLEGLKNFL